MCQNLQLALAMAVAGDHVGLDALAATSAKENLPPHAREYR
jgi:thiamine monophosphate synthase